MRGGEVEVGVDVGGSHGLEHARVTQLGEALRRDAREHEGPVLRVEALRHHPLTRALRVDKSTLAALQATLLHYLRGEAETVIPVWRMLATPVEALAGRAADLAAQLHQAVQAIVSLTRLGLAAAHSTARSQASAAASN